MSRITQQTKQLKTPSAPRRDKPVVAETHVYTSRAAKEFELLNAVASAPRWDFAALKDVILRMLASSDKAAEERRASKQGSVTRLKSKLFGSSPQTSRPQLELMKQVFALFSEDELKAEKATGQFRADFWKRIKAQDTAKVPNLLQASKQLFKWHEANAQAHAFLRPRVVRGEPIPDSMVYVRQMMDFDQVGKSRRPRQGGFTAFAKQVSANTTARYMPHRRSTKGKPHIVRRSQRWEVTEWTGV